MIFKKGDYVKFTKEAFDDNIGSGSYKVLKTIIHFSNTSKQLVILENNPNQYDGAWFVLDKKKQDFNEELEKIISESDETNE